MKVSLSRKMATALYAIIVEYEEDEPLQIGGAVNTIEEVDMQIKNAGYKCPESFKDICNVFFGEEDNKDGESTLDFKGEDIDGKDVKVVVVRQWVLPNQN